MSRRLIALDWNGTLFDDVEAHVKAANEFLAFFGRGPIDLETYRTKFEIPIINFVRATGCDEDLFVREAPRLSAEFHRAVDAYSAESTLRPGAPEFLSWAEGHDVSLIILSNHLDTLIDKELRRQGIAGHFDAASILANQESHATSHRRGKGEKLAAYMAEHGIEGGDVLVVGDTGEEADIARQVGASSALLTGGYSTEQRLAAARPDILADDFEGLKRGIAGLWNLGP